MTLSSPPSKSIWVWLFAFFLTVAGAQCWVVWLYGSPLPFWDQWDEAVSLFQPWKEGHLTWADLANPASDHRIILTKFLDMALIGLNGRWDPLLEMTVDVFIHALFAAGLAYCLWRLGGRRRPWLVCGLLLPFYTLPFAGENAIWGMNSLWYFINFFALITIVGMGFFQSGSWLWWLGVVAGVLGLLSMALGPVAPLAVGGLVGLRAIKQRRLTKDGLVTLGACLGLVVLGAALTVRAEGYRPLQAHSVVQFAAALLRQLDWPFYNLPGIALVILAPLGVLLIHYLKVNLPGARAAELLLTLALWSLLSSAMLAFGRANYGDQLPASRYTEVFALLLVTSLFAALLLCEQWHRDGLLKWNPCLLPLVLAGLLFWGMGRMANIVVDNLLAPTRMENLIGEERVAAFAASGNEAEFLQPPTIRPHPQNTLEVLRNPKLQPILPVVCRPANPAPELGWPAKLSRVILGNGMTMTAAGLALFTVLCGVGLARKTMDLSFKKPEGILILLAALAALGLVMSKHSLRRESVEYDMQRQLADYFQGAGHPDRAAIHAHKAAELQGRVSP